MIHYSNFTDAELIAKCKAGDEEAKNEIYLRYESLIDSIARNKCSQYDDLEFEDIKQILSYGFAKAIKTFDEKKKSSLAPLAKRCMLNAFVDHKRYLSARKKVKPSNYQSEYHADERTVTALDKLPSNSANPENIILEKIAEKITIERINEIALTMSDTERAIVECKLEHMDEKNVVVSRILGVNLSKVYYTLDKVWKKLQKGVWE